MAEIVVYSSMWCPYCARAKALLDRKGVTYQEVDVFSDSRRREEMRIRAGGRNTVPQIFIGDTHVGGCDDLHALDAAGRLDPLLAEMRA
ncbi:MAG: glutaredoxin 3 [Thalassobaculales bacterium]